jgi:mercuric ion binding protein
MARSGRTATSDVTNMDCAVCPITVRKSLENVPGVNSAKVDFKTPDALTKATTDAGYPSTVKQLR